MDTSVYSNGSYMIFSDKFVYAYEDKVKNNQQTYGFPFLVGEVVAVELDKERNTIRFRNETT